MSASSYRYWLWLIEQQARARAATIPTGSAWR